MPRIIMFSLTVYEEMVFSQSSYRLKRTICGSVAFRMRSPNFSTLRQAWNGSCNSDPLITILGKSSKCTYTQKKNEVTVTSTTYLFLHSIPVITTLYLADVVGALLQTKHASTRIYGPIFPYASTFLISQNSLKVLTATCYAGLALSENIAQHTGACLEILAFSLLSHTVFQ
jgi:hypothetical protein